MDLEIIITAGKGSNMHLHCSGQTRDSSITKQTKPSR